MSRLHELRLLTRVARMYHEADLRQPEIARRLNLSQATISRLLQRAVREGIVRVTVTAPAGTFPHLEEALGERYGLQEVIVVDSLRDDERQIMRDLGGAAAYYVEATARPGEVVGVASYASLLDMVNAMRPLPLSGSPAEPGADTADAPGEAGTAQTRVVQLSGGVGNPAAEAHATQLTRRLADLLRGVAILLPAPGLAASPAARALFVQDPFVRQALDTLDHVTLALTGIGSPGAVSPAGFMSAFSPAERALLMERGAAGFICHRFFDARGAPVESPLDERVIAMSRAQLARVPRVVGISGGPQRLAAIRGALEGRWINVLLTDRFTAERLIEGRPK